MSQNNHLYQITPDIIFQNVGLVLMLIYTWVIAAQMFMIDIILEYTFEGPVRYMFKFVYFIVQFVVGVLGTFQLMITPFFFYFNAS